MSKITPWLLAGAAVALTASVAVAQTGETAQRQAAEDAAGASRSGVDRIERREHRVYRHGDGDGDHKVHVHSHGARSDHLADILQLRPDQQPALKTFLEATRRDGEHRDHMVKFGREAGRSTLQRLDDMQARMAEQQAEANRRIAAIRTFYAQLDAPQRKAFDAMPMLMMVGPSMGPMVIPRRIAMADPPEPPRPPKPPQPPRY